MMEDDANFPVEINRRKDTSFVDLSKKRKLHDEQLSMPFPKHICSNRTLECDSDPIMVENGLSRGYETDIESLKDSNSTRDSSDSIMSISGEMKIDLESPKMCSSDQPSTSSALGDSFKDSLYSLESRSVTKSSSSKSEPSNFSGENYCPYHHFGLHPSLDYEEHLLELGSHVECSCSEYRINSIEHTEPEDLLYGNDVAHNSYVLSSGRWTIHQDAAAQPGTKKLTIDKEFEEYFSMLMM